jgi:hypothetical protein
MSVNFSRLYRKSAKSAAVFHGNLRRDTHHLTRDSTDRGAMQSATRWSTIPGAERSVLRSRGRRGMRHYENSAALGVEPEETLSRAAPEKAMTTRGMSPRDLPQAAPPVSLSNQL